MTSRLARWSIGAVVTLVGFASQQALACADPAVAVDVVTYNARSLTSATWVLYANPGKPEGPGWEVYLPLVLNTLKSECAPDTAGFAASLKRWQAANGLGADGKMGLTSATHMKKAWQAKRAHVGRKPCLEIENGNPALKAVPASLAFPGSEGRKAHDSASQAWSRLMVDAQQQLPGIAGGRIISPWRSAKADRAKCAANPGSCNGNNKTSSCSAHWSGYAFDVDVGHAPGFGVIDTSYKNRLHQTRQPLYRWLVSNAHRYGFVNYSFEPWHWEWQP